MAESAAISVDVEDWYHPELVRDRVPANDPRSIVRSATAAILDRLRRHRVRATFFVLGDVARRHPDLVRRIADEGHELGAHGDTHRPLWTLTPESFRAELRAARAAVRDALGTDPMIGFRAPTFSLDRGTAWALDVLADEGFRYDSSVFPVRVRLYGVAGAPLDIYRVGRDPAVPDPNGRLVEFPVAVLELAGRRLPVAGGFYLRALPAPLLLWALDRIVRRRPAALYLHPWECAPDVPRVRLPALDSWITYLGLRSAPHKLEALLRRYAMAPMRDILERGGHLSSRGAPR